MNIAIGSDHGGYELKEYFIRILKGSGHTVVDFGCKSDASVDYPDFAEMVCQSVMKNETQIGVLICGTGIGMSMAANRHHQIRAALCNDEYSARMSREHNNANVLCLGARVLGRGVAAGILETWLKSEFSGGRHQVRIEKFS